MSIDRSEHSRGSAAPEAGPAATADLIPSTAPASDSGATFIDSDEGHDFAPPERYCDSTLYSLYGHRPGETLPELIARVGTNPKATSPSDRAGG